jgi:hypothetical protein
MKDFSEWVVKTPDWRNDKVDVEQAYPGVLNDGITADKLAATTIRGEPVPVGTRDVQVYLVYCSSADRRGSYYTPLSVLVKGGTAQEAFLEGVKLLMADPAFDPRKSCTICIEERQMREILKA